MSERLLENTGFLWGFFLVLCLFMRMLSLGKGGGLCYFKYLFFNVFLDSLEFLRPNLFVL